MKSTYLILGGSSSIGLKAIESIYSTHKTAKVIAQYNTNKEQLTSLKETYPTLQLCQADLSDTDSLNSFISQLIEANTIPSRILQLAAPKYQFIRFKKFTWDDFSKNIDIQVKSTALILQAFLPYMTKEKFGRIVLMLSSATMGVPPLATSPYTTSKYALLGLLKSVASEYASKGICINGISPSMVETPFLNDIPEKLIEIAAHSHPLKRNATVSDIAPYITHLLSEEAQFMTGANIPVTGGELF
ncbi:NAD(P)-dependent oxidoreductase [Candidatus Marinamargulisbacteria bacterium SCGC AAA071-K20]|nr:NAD(P)-dependent oxidoreductase [Candidatus Marinamargulisbacteria bacterium SCGC AAA071-K20]